MNGSVNIQYSYTSFKRFRKVCDRWKYKTLVLSLGDMSVSLLRQFWIHSDISKKGSAM